MIEEITAAFQKIKPATAAGYDNIYIEFLKHLVHRALSWMSMFFCRIMSQHSIPKIWRKAKVIAVEKPGKVTRIQSVVLRRIGGRVVTSGHVTKMAGTPFDQQWPETTCYTQTSRIYLL